QGFAVEHSHHELRRSGSGGGCRHLLSVGANSVQFGEILAHSLDDWRSVQFSFERNAPRNGVESACKAEHSRELTHTFAYVQRLHTYELVLHVGGRGQCDPFKSAGRRKIQCYSRPRSRWRRLTLTPGSAASRSASSRAIAT